MLASVELSLMTELGSEANVDDVCPCSTQEDHEVVGGIKNAKKPKLVLQISMPWKRRRKAQLEGRFLRVVH